MAERLSARLRVPADCREMARLTARFHGTVHRAAGLRASTLLDLLQAADALRRPERLADLLRACAADALSRPGRSSELYEPTRILNSALEIVKSVDAGAIARAYPAARDLPAKIREARVEALVNWKKSERRAASA